jgi:hypothetical protein
VQPEHAPPTRTAQAAVGLPPLPSSPAAEAAIWRPQGMVAATVMGSGASKGGTRRARALPQRLTGACDDWFCSGVAGRCAAPSNRCHAWTAGVMFLVSSSRRSVKLAVSGRRAAAIVPHDGR